ncbi:hypothetical protein GCM10027413_22100 [Conyzicola nivalis]|uniref:Lipoprotein n=1 Tax=Conyzicola nivalis TaxID=1477021 RepID=A0A916WFP9_9MICO|nr:hypothetical protein [Conyzicola nivalis]GGA93065.1 hypothetical protein GCM10010979_04520 [Conyzicola nivalis]
MNRGGCLVAAAAAIVVVLSGCTARELPAGPTEADVDRYYDAIADAHWNALGFDPAVPRPDIEIGFTTAETWAEQVARCLNEAGFDGYSEQGGTLLVTGDATNLEQSAEEKLANYRCQIAHQVRPVAGQILSAAQLEYVYDYYVRFLVPCLEARGEEITDMPDRESFLAESFVGAWSPYWSSISADREEFARLRVECPPMPPGIAVPWE